MTKEIIVPSLQGGFQEDKDLARKLRREEILPELTAGRDVILDFEEVRYATQSFIHALIGEALQQYGENILDKIEFRNCSSQIKSLIELVVDYSLGGFTSEPSSN